MLLGAIDLGSNAIRFLVASAENYGQEWQFQRIEYLRYPLRLGEDVFTTQLVSDKKLTKLLKTMESFRTLFEVFEVQAFHACATSAMRDASNKAEVLQTIKEKTGVLIEVIDGDKEAKLIDRALVKFIDNKEYIHIDVGGGSTEVNLIANNKKVASKSFNIGTVRAIHYGIADSYWNEVRNWLGENAKGQLFSPIAIGTGGNIRKLHELSGLMSDVPMGLDQLIDLKNRIRTLPLQQRIDKLKLNQDRADVIVPAAEIYINIMQWSGSSRIVAPNVGLIDGIIIDLHERMEFIG